MLCYLVISNRNVVTLKSRSQSLLSHHGLNHAYANPRWDIHKATSTISPPYYNHKKDHGQIKCHQVVQQAEDSKSPNSGYSHLYWYGTTDLAFNLDGLRRPIPLWLIRANLVRHWRTWLFWPHCHCFKIPTPSGWLPKGRIRISWTFWARLCLTRGSLTTRLPTYFEEG